MTSTFCGKAGNRSKNHKTVCSLNTICRSSRRQSKIGLPMDIAGKSDKFARFGIGGSLAAHTHAAAAQTGHGTQILAVLVEKKSKGF